MRHTLLFVTLVTVMSAVAPSASGSATESRYTGSPAILATPASRATTYATPIAVVQPGDELTFLNLEPFPHTVRSFEMGPDNTVWCNPPKSNRPAHPKTNPRRFPVGKCPLLWTPPISMTNGVLQSKVYGTANLESGTTVDFYCTVFPNMEGTLIVI